MVRVYTPTSSANMGVGLDMLGAAVTPVDGALLGDVVTAKAAETLSLSNLGRFADKLPSEPRENIVYRCWEHFCQKLDKQIPVAMTLKKNMLISSGLGSSACSVVAALMAMNEYCGKPLNNTHLLTLMGELEGRISGSIYYDNVAPCFLGGIQLMIGESDIISQQVPEFDEWLWVLAYPGIKVSTAETRTILPAQHRRQGYITHGRHLTGFIHACYSRQPELAAKPMKDVVAELYRERLLPGFRQTRQAVAEIGAVANGISDSGPTLPTLCGKPDTTQRVADWLGKNYLQNREGFVHICRLDTAGARILESQMKLYSLKGHNEQVSFAQAVAQELSKNQGLFFPYDLPEFSLTEIDEMLKLDFVTRSAKILPAFIGNEIPQKILEERVRAAFAFPVPVANVKNDTGCLKLFREPTLALKDFSGRFMVQVLTHIAGDKPATILATISDDAGAAVAHAFYGLPSVKMVILYLRGKISPLQKKLFYTLGDSIETVVIDDDFDVYQALVEQTLDDEELKVAPGLNSTNSINISCLLAQIYHCFEAAAQLPQETRNQLVVSMPSGNFDDLMAGLLAKPLGLSVKRFIATANVNDTMPHFLRGSQWSPKATQATLPNAMNVSQPDNWSRVEELFHRKIWRLKKPGYTTVDDETTQQTMHELKELGYTSEPHATVAYHALRDQLNPGEYGLFLGTAYPARFKGSVEAILGETLDLPKELAERTDLSLLSHNLPADFAALRKLMTNHQ